MAQLTLVVASANPDKVREIEAILRSVLSVDLVPRPEDVDEVEEDADTLEGNARLKAVSLCEATGLASVADDTGLEVDAILGAPGVRSARYAGEDATYLDNVAKLLLALATHPVESTRTARFRTVALCRFPDGSEVIADGVIEGLITTMPRGDGGFGYDSVFQPSDGDGRTFAEMTPDEKHGISHRGRAFRALARDLAGHTSS